jgi:hypothetical protein
VGSGGRIHYPEATGLLPALNPSSAFCPRVAEGWTWEAVGVDAPGRSHVAQSPDRASLPPADRAASYQPAVAPADVPDGLATPAAAVGMTDSAAAVDYSPPRADGSGAARCRDRLLRHWLPVPRQGYEWPDPAAEDFHRNCPELKSRVVVECASRARKWDSHVRHSAACCYSGCHYPRWKAADCERFDPQAHCHP